MMSSLCFFVLFHAINTAVVVCLIVSKTSLMCFVTTTATSAIEGPFNDCCKI